MKTSSTVTTDPVTTVVSTKEQKSYDVFTRPRDAAVRAEREEQGVSETWTVIDVPTQEIAESTYADLVQRLREARLRETEGGFPDDSFLHGDYPELDTDHFESVLVETVTVTTVTRSVRLVRTLAPETDA